MQDVTKQILLKQPNYTLELVKHADDSGSPCHAFVMHPTLSNYAAHETQGVTLLTGRGHDVSRRDVHYALYLFQRFHLNQTQDGVCASQ